MDENESSDKELAKGIAKIMEVLIGEREYRLKTSKIEPDAVYVDREFSQLISKQKVLKRVYKSFAFAVNTLLTFTDSYKLQSACLRLLVRFYDLFDVRYRHMLESPIITCLQSITLMEDSDKHETAAEVFFKFLNSPTVPESFKGKLQQDLILEPLKSSEHFKEKA